MKLFRKTTVCIIVFLMLATYGNSFSIEKNRRMTEELDTLSLLDGAKLEEHNGLKILYVNGSYYEMGYQHGYLLKDEVNENIRAFIDHGEKISSYDYLLDMWNITEPYIPECYIQEMHGIADGADVSFEKLSVVYMIIPFIDLQCFTFAAWSNATQDEKLCHIRSLDFPLVIDDPDTGKYLQENSVLMIRKPNDGLKSINPSIAGLINFYQGINEKQISVGIQVCWSNDQTLKSIPVQFKILKIMDTAENLQEAVDILTSNKTLGWNFIISDGKINQGYVVETTANYSYVGTWNNSVEGTRPFWKIENVVRRTNFFVNPTLASTQRKNYKISGIKSFMDLFNGEPYFALWRKYRSMSKEIEKNWGDINVERGISLLRKVYTGRTDFLLFMFLFLGEESILRDFQQWAVCPDTGEFVFSFADSEKFSHDSELHYFNIYDFFFKNLNS
ncbi:MAG: C45 family peptidase [Candidatus Thermoplasmatota archaeon]